MASFLDKVVVGINKGVNSVSEGSKNLVEKAKLNTQIQDSEKERDRVLLSLGNLIYNLQMQGEITLEQATGMCNDITMINQRIEGLQAQVQALEAPKPQPTYTAPAAPAAPVNTGAQCQCGFVNKEGAKFCAKCGTPL